MTNAEKQARYRERHHGVDGEKVRVGLNLNASTMAKMGRLRRRRGYTITTLVEELVERAEWRERARLPYCALKVYYDAGWLWYNHISAGDLDRCRQASSLP